MFPNDLPAPAPSWLSTSLPDTLVWAGVSCTSLVFQPPRAWPLEMALALAGFVLCFAFLCLQDSPILLRWQPGGFLRYVSLFPRSRIPHFNIADGT